MGKRWKNQTAKSLKAKDARFRAKRDEMISQGRVTPAVVIQQSSTEEIETTFVYKVIFLCAHQGRFIEPSPRPNDVLWCYRCCDYQRVIKVDQSVLRRVKLLYEESNDAVSA